MANYIVCPHCGSHLDHGERCDCQRIDLQPEEIPGAALNGTARAALHAAAKAFEDPAFAADYERWLAERNTKKAAV